MPLEGTAWGPRPQPAPPSPSGTGHVGPAPHCPPVLQAGPGLTAPGSVQPVGCGASHETAQVPTLLSDPLQIPVP